MADVVLAGVSKRYGEATVVDRVDLTIANGEFMVLVGPSGCGKSTTLRMIAGLESVSDGTVSIGGRDVTRLQPKDRNIAMVFQNYALYAHKTVRANLAFGLRMRGTPRAETARRVQAAAEMLGITDLLERKPKQLSGGQRQRVALGRALVREPDVFLLDEPLSNLDAKLRVRMREEIGRLHAATGTSMVYVTHDQVEAMTLGDRIAVMKDGRVQQVGAPLELYDRPANAFVAGFIGSPEMNQVPARLAGGRIEGDGFSLAQPAGIAGGVAAVLLGIRPEHLALAAPGQGQIPVTVELIEQMGAQSLLICGAGGTALRALINRDDRIRRGDRVELTVEARNLHLFDAKTGDALGRDTPAPDPNQQAQGGLS
jgi:ABC-type sugar transport system ATPase subunit